MSFWSELKRRNVFKVGAAYVIVAWVILQAVSIIFPMLILPPWTGTFVTVLIFIGFPVALVFSWAFEMTPDGVKRTAHINQDNVAESEVAPTVAEQTFSPVEVGDTKKEPKTIAVLPFEDLSHEKDQGYFVDGLIEELLNGLAHIPDLNVTGRTSSFSFKGSNKTVQEIAEVLGVENILEGSVRKAGNDLRITAQLLRGADGFHLWSKTYDRELKDIFAVQENIARAVADELQVTLGIVKSPQQLGATDNVEAYAHYLAARGKMYFVDSVLKGYASESIETAIAIDPNFALALVAKANIHNVLAVFGPASNAFKELDIALNAARSALDLEPNLASGYAMLGWAKRAKGDFIGSELANRKALKLPTETDLGSKTMIAPHYNAVGNFERARELLEEILRNDPLNEFAWVHYIISLSMLGNMQQAENKYKQSKTLFGENNICNLAITIIRIASGKVIAREDIVSADPIYNTAKEHLDSPEEGLKEIHKLYVHDDNLSSAEYNNVSVCAAYWGDPEFSMDALEKGLSIDATGIINAWFPVMHEVRQLPSFKKFVREIGLVEYWEQFGWPDICRPTDDDDFECD